MSAQSESDNAIGLDDLISCSPIFVSANQWKLHVLMVWNAVDEMVVALFLIQQSLRKLYVFMVWNAVDEMVVALSHIQQSLWKVKLHAAGVFLATDLSLESALSNMIMLKWYCCDVIVMLLWCYCDVIVMLFRLLWCLQKNIY